MSQLIFVPPLTSVNHLGVLVHGETQVLVLHGFLDEVDHFSMLQFLLPLLDICICSFPL